MIVDVPSGVDSDVEMMTPVAHVGEHEVSVNVATAPAGSPEAVKGTGFGVPVVRMAPTAFITDDPRLTDWLPAFARTKLKFPVPDWAVTSGPRTPRAANIKNVRRHMRPRRRARQYSRERTSPSRSCEVANVANVASRWEEAVWRSAI